MNHRERFRAVMHFERVDRIPIWDFGFWDETIQAWYDQGLPRGVSTDEFFGMDPQWRGFGPHMGMIPGFQHEVIEQTEDWEIIRDGAGVLQKRSRKGATIPQFLEFPVKNREDFEEMIKRYDPDDPRRIHADLDQRAKELADRDYPLHISGGGWFGWMRNWMGLENAAMLFYDDPELVHDMMDWMADFVCKLVHPYIDRIDYEWAHYWEDMAYNKASLISPAMFREFMVGPYKKVTGLFREHGIDVHVVDCDGNIEELIPCFMEGGVNCMFPIEIGVWKPDLMAWRKQYGKDLLMIGGIDKTALMHGKKEVEEEVYSKVPQLIKIGGYIPLVDHRVPPDVPLENYQYYLELIRKVAVPEYD